MRVQGVLLGILASTRALACCAVGAGGASVRFAGQTNLIVWDKVHGVEHFVRDARFDTKAKDLGFLAPTPDRPSLGTADPKVFETLDALRPAEEGAPAATGPATRGATKSPVTVLEARDVAGYHATVLQATDAAALAAWLAKNGYSSPKYLTDWVAPYVAKGWYLTAFRVNGEKTGPIRMSFPAKEPFNPYAVPAENGGRVPLRLYYVSPGREVPKIGGETTWRKPAWAVRMRSEELANLAESLYLTPDRVPEGATLTVYDDDGSGKAGLDDLYFVPDERPAQAALGVAAGAVALGAVFLLRRRRARTGSDAPEGSARDRPSIP